MALDLSKLNFFNKLDARSRVGVIFAVVIGVILIFYLVTRYFAGDSVTGGNSSVASAPRGLQSTPGGVNNAAYQQALSQANTQAAEQAKMTGGSAIDTLINTGLPAAANSGQCIVCSDKSAKVNTLLEQLVREGKISPEVSSALIKLADRNVSVDDYANELDRLVKDGKLTPDQARDLLEQYKKQHDNALLNESAATMDSLIKSGRLPVDVANQLLASQKSGMTPAQYAANLQRLVNEGKISAATAEQLAAQYSKQYGKQLVGQSVANLAKMAAQGEITPDVLKTLTDLETQNVPVDELDRKLQQLVTSGKLTPAAAQKILADYRQKKSMLNARGALDDIAAGAENNALQDISKIVKDPVTAAQLQDLIKNKISAADYKKNLDQMVKDGKLSPEQARALMDSFNKLNAMRNTAANLTSLQANNGSASDYADALKRAVANGTLTPDEAKALYQEYKTLHSNAVIAAANDNSGSAFSQLQQRVESGDVALAAPDVDFSATSDAARQEDMAAREDRLQAIAAAMSTQAGELVTAWQPGSMTHTQGSAATASDVSLADSKLDEVGKNKAAAVKASLIKAGTIIFAVLDTAVNSDYPDSPIMATIVQGQFKGSKLMGKLVTTKGISGQQDRITLNFTLMNNDAWTNSQAVSAYAIDPDTSRTVFASEVNYHYLQRWGAIFATSFIQGYANAIQSSGSTTQTGLLGTSSTHPQLSPGEKLASAIGQIGQNLASVTQNYVNIPPTVKVDSGVGLGILFMADLTPGN